jgi:predicted nucleotidyltransferase
MEPYVSALARLAERFDLQDIYVFGSRAHEIARRVRGGEGPEPTPQAAASDVDIAVQSRRGSSLNARQRVDLGIQFEDLLDVARVDLTVLSEARPFLAVDVIRGELLHTSDPVAQAEHELYILRRAGDLAPFQRARVRDVLDAGAR